MAEKKSAQLIRESIGFDLVIPMPVTISYYRVRNGPDNKLVASANKKTDLSAPTLVRNDLPSAPHRRNPADPEAIRRIAALLFKSGDPTLPSSHLSVTTRDIPHLYTRGVHGAVERRLFHALVNREHLFVQGATIGVGASVFVADYARAYNLMARSRNNPQRVAHVILRTGTTTVKRFLEALCEAVQAPMTASEFKMSSPLALGQRILAQAVRLRLSAIIIDHVHMAAESVRDAVADLMIIADPRYTVPLEIDGAAPRDRIGVILVDHQAPEKLFQGHPQVLSLLQGSHALLSPYSSVGDVADVLMQADIGLEDLDLADPEDLAMAEFILSATDGMINSMGGFLRLVDLLCTMHDNCRPDLGLMEAALPYHRKMLKVLSSNKSSGAVSLRRVPAVQQSQPASTPEKTGSKLSAPKSKPKSQAKAKPSRASVLKGKNEAKRIAKGEQRDMQRQRGYAVLPESLPDKKP